MAFDHANHPTASLNAPSVRLPTTLLLPVVILLFLSSPCIAEARRFSDGRILPGTRGLAPITTCSDGVQNGVEQPAGCGGTTCDPCTVDEVLYMELRGGDTGLGLCWVASKNDCKSIGMTLPAIHSQERLDELYAHISATDVWIGVTDSELEGTFVWVDGSSLTFENWGQDEPKDNQQNKVREMRGALNSSTILLF